MKILFMVLCYCVCVNGFDESIIKSIPLADVNSLTFNSDKLTHRRYLPSVSQMTCVGLYCNVHHLPTSMQCINTGYTIGYDGVEITWKCTTILQGYMLGMTTVKCEGYSFSNNYMNDDYILVGSCGVTYQLIPDNTYIEPIMHSVYTSTKPYFYVNDITIIIVGIVIIYMLCSMYSQQQRVYYPRYD